MNIFFILNLNGTPYITPSKFRSTLLACFIEKSFFSAVYLVNTI